MKYFYSKEKNSKLLGSLAYDDSDILEYLNGNPFIDYPHLNNSNTVISKVLFSNPTWTGTELREMTREEICDGGDLSILVEGEIYQGGVIKIISRPQGVKLQWQYPNWIETATLEEQLEFYKQEILKVNRELLVYEKAGFTNQELQIKLNELIKKHNEISFDIASEENKFF